MKRFTILLITIFSIFILSSCKGESNITYLPNFDLENVNTYAFDIRQNESVLFLLDSGDVVLYEGILGYLLTVHDQDDPDYEAPVYENITNQIPLQNGETIIDIVSYIYGPESEEFFNVYYLLTDVGNVYSYTVEDIIDTKPIYIEGNANNQLMLDTNETITSMERISSYDLNYSVLEFGTSLGNTYYINHYGTDSLSRITEIQPSLQPDESIIASAFDRTLLDEIYLTSNQRIVYYNSDDELLQLFDPSVLGLETGEYVIGFQEPLNGISIYVTNYGHYGNLYSYQNASLLISFETDEEITTIQPFKLAAGLDNYLVKTSHDRYFITNENFTTGYDVPMIELFPEDLLDVDATDIVSVNVIDMFDSSIHYSGSETRDYYEHDIEFVLEIILQDGSTYWVAKLHYPNDEHGDYWSAKIK